MKKTTAAILLIAAAALAGCQTTSTLDTSGSAAQKTRPAVISKKAAAGKMQFEDGNFGLAQKEFRSAVETHPQDATAWLGLAASYDKLGRFDLADQAYERLLSLKGRKPAILNNYGFSHILRGDLKKARSLLNEARATAPLSSVIEANWKLAHAE